MATFGSTATTGGAFSTVTNNVKQGTEQTLAEDGTVSKLTAYLTGLGGGAGTQVAKGVIYNDDAAGAEPGTLMGTSNEVTTAQNDAAAWVDFTFASAVSLTAGNWIIGLIYGATSNVIQVYRVTGSGASYSDVDTYVGGAADPWSADPTLTVRVYSIYATYTVASSACPINLLRPHIIPALGGP